MSAEDRKRNYRYSDTVSYQVNPGGTVTNTYIVEPNRGPVQAIGVVPQTTTPADLIGSEIVIRIGGNEFIRLPMFQFLNSYQDVPKVVPCFAESNQNIQITLVDASGNTYQVAIVFYYNLRPEEYGQHAP